MTLSTHVLDATLGRPAAGVGVFLDSHDEERGWLRQHLGMTGEDGRMLLPGDNPAGSYRFTFLTGAYFRARAVATFYPEVTITFTVTEAAGHYHVPLLLSPYGYSTYRGS